MQDVSVEYMDSMKSPIRNKGYIEVTLRLVDGAGKDVLLQYDNDNVISSSYSNAMSPICAELPQDDFSVKINNQDRMFDIDNPDSPINFLSKGNEVKFRYGYLVEPDRIEWLKWKTVYLSSWNADDKVATFTATDPVRFLDEKYVQKERANTPDIEDLFMEIVEGSKVDLLYIPAMSTATGKYQKIPVPDKFPKDLKKKEALQILTNAYCMRAQIYNGNRLVITPQRTLDAYENPPESYMNANELSVAPSELNKKRDNVVSYAFLSFNHTRVDGSCLFRPVNPANKLDAGFITGDVNAEDIKIFWSNQNMYECSGIHVEFNSDSLPEEVEVYTFGIYETPGGQTYPDTFRERYKITEKVNELYFDRLRNVKEVSLIFNPGEQNAQRPLIRTAVSRVFLINRDGGEITKNEMLSYPLAKSEELVKNITVEWYEYPSGGDPVVHHLGQRVHDTGTKDITWKNPMVTSRYRAEKLLKQLVSFYKDNVYYEYATRGNPELDSGDIILQDNDYATNFEVQLMNQTLDFATSFRGTVKTKRIGGGR